MKPAINTNPSVPDHAMRPTIGNRTSSLPAYEDIEMQAGAVTSPELPNPPNSRNSINEAPAARLRLQLRLQQRQRRSRSVSVCRTCTTRSRFFRSTRQKVLFWLSFALLLFMVGGQVFLYGVVSDHPTTVCEHYPELLAMFHGGFASTVTMCLGGLTFAGGLLFARSSPAMVMTFLMLAFACLIGVSYVGGLADPTIKACPGSVMLLRDNGTWPEADAHLRYVEAMN